MTEIVVIVSAWAPEQRVLREAMGTPAPVWEASPQELGVTLPWTDAESSEVERLRAPARAWARGRRVHFVTTGVGTPAAAARVAMFLATQLPSPGVHNGPSIVSGRVLFCATAGVYPSARERYPIEHVVQVRRVLWGDGTSLAGSSYLPPGNRSFEVLTSPRNAPTDEDQASTCLSTPAITRSAELATLLGERAALENLELYGVACALAAAGDPLPWEAFLGISNEVGPASHKEWLAHHSGASLAAQQALFEDLVRDAGVTRET